MPGTSSPRSGRRWSVPRPEVMPEVNKPAELRRPGAPPRLSIVIPVWNEEANLPALYQRLAPVLDAIEGQRGGGVEAIFVDDGSADRSLPILRDLAARDGRVKVISFNRNYGQ